MTAHLQALALVWAVVAPKSLLTVGGQPSWGPEEVGREDLLVHHQPHNTSLDLPPDTRLQVDPAPPQEPPSVGSEALDPNPCPISAQRLASASLLVRWERSVGFQCDVLLFTTSSHGRSSFSTALTGVSSPAVVDHVGAGGGSQGQQMFKLCVGCGGARLGRGPRRRSPSLRAERVDFCCLDFRLEELRGDPGWRLNRKPIESTLVACFMTIVIIIWSVAALIWPVPIIAGFLPNGMEQRRG